MTLNLVSRIRSYVPYLIALVMAINGFLNLLLGLANIFQFQQYLNLETVSDFVDVTPTAQFGGFVAVLLGSILIGVGKGLAERSRRAWWLAVVVLALLILYHIYSGPTIGNLGSSVVILMLLITLRSAFTHRTERRSWTYAELIAAISVLFALAYGIVGAYLLRRDFNAINDWTDAVYFTVVTYSTLGYGDILPTTSNAKLFTISMVVIGLSSFVTALTVLVGPLIEERMKGVFSAMSKFQKTVNHVVVCGASHVTESVVDELTERNIPFLIIEENDRMALYLKDRGFDVVQGDPTLQTTLEQANLPNATAVIAATDSDATNTLIALTAQALREESPQHRFRIIIRVEDEENMEKVTKIGVDEVISPSTMGGRMMASQAVLQPDEKHD